MTLCLSLHTILLSFSFYKTPRTPYIYTLSLHDALPIWVRGAPELYARAEDPHYERSEADRRTAAARLLDRSEEHTSELQSLTNLVCRLLLEKKKKKKYNERSIH